MRMEIPVYVAARIEPVNSDAMRAAEAAIWFFGAIFFVGFGLDKLDSLNICPLVSPSWSR
jgi:hypothetical protein